MKILYAAIKIIGYGKRQVFCPVLVDYNGTRPLGPSCRTPEKAREIIEAAGYTVNAIGDFYGILPKR